MPDTPAVLMLSCGCCWAWSKSLACERLSDKRAIWCLSRDNIRGFSCKAGLPCCYSSTGSCS